MTACLEGNPLQPSRVKRRALLPCYILQISSEETAIEPKDNALLNPLLDVPSILLLRDLLCRRGGLNAYLTTQ